MENEDFVSLLHLEMQGKIPNLPDTDFKAEVVVAGLIEQGYDPDRIVQIRLGAGKRGYAKDVETVELQYSEHDNSDYLYIKTNREGIYDMLPEGVFHRTENRRFVQDSEDMIDEIRIHREEEFFARRFFRLFEIEADRLRTEITLFETEFDRKMSHSRYTDIFVPFWDILTLMERRQAVLFLHTVPLLHRIHNCHGEIEAAMSSILDVPIKIETVLLETQDADGAVKSELGKKRLGVDLIIGCAFNDGQYDIRICAGPMPSLKMKDFLKGETSDRILDELCRLYLPANVFCVKEYLIDPEDSAFIISDEQTITWLGINSFI